MINRYPQFDRSRLCLLPLEDRCHDLSLSSALPLLKVSAVNQEFTKIASKIIEANKQKSSVVLMMGAHVLRSGVQHFLIDMMERGYINCLAVNGAFAIHDFELALIGETSEYVEQTIEDGTFGMIEETGSILNEAIKEGAKNNYGMGYAVGKKINDLNLPNKGYSILYNAYKLNIPVTVHAAIGTDIIHQHPNCDGAAVGKTSYQDFKIFAESVSRLEDGVILNVGCAVILPEVFLKALTIARKLGYKVENITAANFDMINHYRPRENVVQRPTSLGGKGFIIIERHEKTIPTLHRKIVDLIKK